MLKSPLFSFPGHCRPVSACLWALWCRPLYEAGVLCRLSGGIGSSCDIVCQLTIGCIFGKVTSRKGGYWYCAWGSWSFSKKSDWEGSRRTFWGLVLWRCFGVPGLFGFGMVWRNVSCIGLTKVAWIAKTPTVSGAHHFCKQRFYAFHVE